MLESWWKTFDSNWKKHRKDRKTKTSFLEEIAENIDLHKLVLNKIMARQE